jgi:hypothetical protein
MLVARALCSVGLAKTWAVIKPVVAAMISGFIFPLLCYDDADEDLWDSDPYEYARVKFG